VFYIDGPSAPWKEFISILTDLVFFPTFPEDELEREKEVIRREMAMYDDDPDSVAYDLLISTLYLKHPRRWPVLGVPDRFNLLTRQDILEYHRERYCPNNIFLVVTGDVDEQAVLDHVKSLTADLKPGSLLSKLPASECHQWGRRTERKEFATPYSKLSLVWRMPKRSHPDSPALSILSLILGGGRSAWLYERFHDQLGIAHYITASIAQNEHDEGSFMICADVDREQRDELTRLVLEEFKKLPEADFSTDITRILKQTKAARLRGLSTASGLAESIAVQWSTTRNIHSTEEWVMALEKVTTEDLRRVAQTWFSPDRLTEVSLDPLGSNTPADDDTNSKRRTSLVYGTLSNGLRVVMRPDHRLPMVYACLSFKAGSPYETQTTAGLSALMAECLLKGTETRSASDIAHRLEDLGGSINASSGHNSISVSCNVLSEDLDTALELMADVVEHPSFPTDAFERERETLISDVEEELEDPISVAFRQVKSTSYGNVSYGNPTSGTVDSLTQLTIDDLKRHHQNLFKTSNAALCLTGDVDPEQVLEALERAFAELPQGDVPIATPTPTQQAGETIVPMQKEQAILVLSLPGLKVSSPDSPQSILFKSWCSDMAGPLFTRIREESGLAYFVSCSMFFGLDAGNIQFYLGTSDDKLAEAKEILIQTLDDIYTNGITPEELERTKATSLSARMLAKQSNGALCQMLALDVLYGLPDHHFEIQEEQIKAMDAETMNQFIRQYLSPNQPRTWAIVTAEEEK
jgi:zinc protease